MRYQPSNWVTPHFIEWITGLELTKSNQYNVEQDRLKVNFIIIYTYIKNVKKKWWLIPLFSLLLNPPQSFSKNDIKWYQTEKYHKFQENIYVF